MNSTNYSLYRLLKIWFLKANIVPTFIWGPVKCNLWKNCPLTRPATSLVVTPRPLKLGQRAPSSSEGLSNTHWILKIGPVFRRQHHIRVTFTILAQSGRLRDHSLVIPITYSVFSCLFTAPQSQPHWFWRKGLAYLDKNQMLDSVTPSPIREWARGLVPWYRWGFPFNDRPGPVAALASPSPKARPSYLTWWQIWSVIRSTDHSPHPPTHIPAYLAG